MSVAVQTSLMRRIIALFQVQQFHGGCMRDDLTHPSAPFTIRFVLLFECTREMFFVSAIDEHVCGDDSFPNSDLFYS
jgi:hypothetical protein